MANQHTKAKEQQKKKTSTKNPIRVEMQSRIEDDGTIGVIPAKDAIPKKRKNKVPTDPVERENAAKAQLTLSLDRIRKKYRVAIEHQFKVGNGTFEHYYLIRALDY